MSHRAYMIFLLYVSAFGCEALMSPLNAPQLGRSLVTRCSSFSESEICFPSREPCTYLVLQLMSSEGILFSRLPSASAGFVAANCRNRNRTRDCQLPAVDFILSFPSTLGIPSAFSFCNWQLQLMNAARRSTCNDTRNADQKRR